MIPVLRTDRLELICLTAYQLAAYLEGGQGSNQAVGSASRAILTERLIRAIGLKLEKLSGASPEEVPWITYWLIQIRADGYGAGLIGFKGAPDHRGEVEIGYGIDPNRRSKGYMTEAVRSLVCWGFQDTRCQRIVAPSTSRSNQASNRVLQKAGFSVYAEAPEEISWCLDRRDWEGE